jgi:hypothetical protein
MRWGGSAIRTGSARLCWMSSSAAGSRGPPLPRPWGFVIRRLPTGFKSAGTTEATTAARLRAGRPRDRACVGWKRYCRRRRSQLRSRSRSRRQLKASTIDMTLRWISLPTRRGPPSPPPLPGRALPASPARPSGGQRPLSRAPPARAMRFLQAPKISESLALLGDAQWYECYSFFTMGPLPRFLTGSGNRERQAESRSPISCSG